MKIAIRVLLIIIFLTGLLVSLNYIGWLNTREAVAQTSKNTTTSNQGKTNPPVKINEKKLLKALDVLRDRPVLSQKDKAAKNKIINTLAKQKYSKTYRDYEIEYIKSADEFLVGINGLNTQKAKYWASMWFKLNGISDQGLCRLPVVFYLKPIVSRQLRPLNIQFEPIPDNC